MLQIYEVTKCFPREELFGLTSQIRRAAVSIPNEVKKRKNKKINNKGFTLIELVIVIAILGILVSIAVPLYTGYVERATNQVCDTNCQQLERMYHVYLIKENKEHTGNEFKVFLQKYEENICPANGDIVYIYGTVRCLLHFEDEAGGNGDDEGNVPFL